MSARWQSANSQARLEWIRLDTVVIFAGPGWRIRDLLRPQFRNVALTRREDFARVLCAAVTSRCPTSSRPIHAHALSSRGVHIRRSHCNKTSDYWFPDDTAIPWCGDVFCHKNDMPECQLMRSGMVFQPPRVSIVIPLYDQADVLMETLTCVQRQTVRDFEVIVIDDGSTDGGGALVEAVADPRFRLLRQENLGV